MPDRRFRPRPQARGGEKSAEIFIGYRGIGKLETNVK